MKIVINTALQRFGGAIQVALSFIYECRGFSDHEYFVWVGPGIQKSLDESDFSSNFHFRYFNFGVINWQKTFHINKVLQQAERDIKPDCIISTTGPSYFNSAAPQVIGYNLGLYIYPESPFIRDLTIKAKLRMLIKKQVHFYFFKRDADAYVVQTDDVNRRVRKALGNDKVYTATNTHSALYNDWKPLPPKLPTKKAGVFRFVTISAYYPHKNLEIIPKVLQELQKQGHQNVQFVLTLKPEDFQRQIGSEYEEHILNVGPIKPADCPSLYAECDAMFLPTLAECFSASYPEAMVMEKPIVTTNLGFARSICGEAALYFKAKDPISAADTIKALASNAELQSELKRKGKLQLASFDTPSSRAEKYLALCKEMG